MADYRAYVGNAVAMVPDFYTNIGYNPNASTKSLPSVTRHFLTQDEPSLAKNAFDPAYYRSWMIPKTSMQSMYTPPNNKYKDMTMSEMYNNERKVRKEKQISSLTNMFDKNKDENGIGVPEMSEAQHVVQKKLKKGGTTKLVPEPQYMEEREYNASVNQYNRTFEPGESSANSERLSNLYRIR